MTWLRVAGALGGMLALLGCGACGDDDATPPDGDVVGVDGGDGGEGEGEGEGGVDGGPDAPRVELGTSARAFVAIDEGDTVELARGCQGGQHVWISLRIRNLEPRSAVVQLQMLRLVDGEPIECDREMPGTTCRPLETCTGLCLNSYPFQVRTTFDVIGTGEYSEITGLTLQTPDPEALLETDVLIRARVTDRSDPPRTAEAQRQVRVVWGTETCASMRDGAVPPGDGGPIPMGDAGTADGG